MAAKRAVSNEVTFEQILSGYPKKMLGCRADGHHWRPVTASRTKEGHIYRVLTCSACGTSRNQTLDRNGYIISSDYSYRPGYVIPGIGRLTAARNAALRLEAISRAPID